MSDQSESIQTEERQAIQDYFIGWQCRVRGFAMRNEGGRPTNGMRPSISLPNGNELSAAAILLLLPVELRTNIQQYRYLVLKTHDPQERLNKAIQLFSSSFYQNIEDFDGTLTGLFSSNSAVVETLANEKKAVIHFSHQQQQFTVPCNIIVYSKKDEAYQFTHWHNKLFNPKIPPDISILGFEPDWTKAIANPGIPSQ